MLLAAGEKSYLVRHGTGRDISFFNLVPVDDAEAAEVGAGREKTPVVIRMGRLVLLPLPIEAGMQPGEIPEPYYNAESGRWTGTIALMRYR